MTFYTLADYSLILQQTANLQLPTQSSSECKWERLTYQPTTHILLRLHRELALEERLTPSLTPAWTFSYMPPTSPSYSDYINSVDINCTWNCIHVPEVGGYDLICRSTIAHWTRWICKILNEHCPLWWVFLIVLWTAMKNVWNRLVFWVKPPSWLQNLVFFLNL